MAESATEIPLNIEESVRETVQNVTEKATNSIEGVAIAYLSLVIMAILPIFFGSFRSVKYLKEQKESGERAETMSNKDALMFPLIASCALFALYIFFQFFSKEYINLLLTGYFFFLGVLALSHLLSPIISFMVPASVPNVPYHIHFTRGERDGRQDIINYKFTSYDVICLLISLCLGAWYLLKKDIINYKFTSYDVICLLISLCLGAWYLLKKHWIANNLFGIAFAINGVELLHLNNVVTGCILLCGLFLYDIFWVFGTNVMVTVAKSFEAPIKLVFPQDLLVNGFNASNFAMLGLGDIVVPGIFIALLLRFDKSLKRNSEFYFRATFTAYVVGLLATILIMHMFKHAQPALLYLVPACLGTPLSLALLKGDINALFNGAFESGAQVHRGTDACSYYPTNIINAKVGEYGCLKRNSEFYFRATFTAYVVGLLATILIMHMFKHAQPALLYLVPACLGTPLSLALLKGDINALFKYEDQPALEEGAVDPKAKKSE